MTGQERNRGTENIMDNKTLIFKCLKALEAHGKVKEIHTLLTDSTFSGAYLSITWSDEDGKRLPILKVLLPNMNESAERKSPNGKDVYYADSITLDGMKYLVYNNWLDNVRKAFVDWVKATIFPELKEIEDVLAETNETPC